MLGPGATVYTFIPVSTLKILTNETILCAV